jgi:bacterioferritin
MMLFYSRSLSLQVCLSVQYLGIGKELPKVWRKESIEEMEHADKFTDRILFLDGFPNLQVLDPLRIGQNVKEIIECDLASEISARALYQEAATYCHGVKDYVSRYLFESLMKDEEHHIDFLETQLDLIQRIGSSSTPRGMSAGSRASTESRQLRFAVPAVGRVVVLVNPIHHRGHRNRQST